MVKNKQPDAPWMRLGGPPRIHPQAAARSLCVLAWPPALWAAVAAGCQGVGVLPLDQEGAALAPANIPKNHTCQMSVACTEVNRTVSEALQTISQSRLPIDFA